ncbi:hypothetical protein [Xenophilus sp. Marseille-Q4582]|uniref:hypothetical protein n=1 Tax=Xenophilus sp. Marseille-Q4582 TaxID=2866600 RepID=UPI001CE3D1F7|nr:hypothetical protein [Xenophilus sp. Marseille-Q4582]
MRLTAPGATPEQLAAGEAAARAYLDAQGVTLEQVCEAWAIYENWVTGARKRSDRPPKEGEDIRAIFAEAGRIAVDTALPEQAGSGHWRGQLEPFEVGPTVDRWRGSFDPDSVPF